MIKPLFSVLFIADFIWLRGADSNRRPGGYEPPELPLLYPALTVLVGFLSRKII